MGKTPVLWAVVPGFAPENESQHVSVITELLQLNKLLQMLG